MEKLLNPRSVAIVGASDKIGPGFNAWKALEHVGFQGKVFLVNPGKKELLEQKCYPSLADIEEDVDAVFVAVKAGSVLEVAKQAVAASALDAGGDDVEHSRAGDREQDERGRDEDGKGVGAGHAA